MRFSAVIVAGGSGARAGAGPAKQWRVLAGQPVLRWSVQALAAAGADPVVVVIPEGAEAEAEQVLRGCGPVLRVLGGASRFLSVQAGLKALGPDAPPAVLIHDAARPFVTGDHVQALIGALQAADGAIPVLPVTDTLKREGPEGLRTEPREGLWRAQTPQAFRLDPLRAAVAAWPSGADPTDDAAVMEQFGGKVALVPGDPRLMKLTYPEDFAMAEALAAAPRQTRVGQGFDAHRFGPGGHIWLCGVKIAHDQGLIGHSDADVGLHALTDALLGAIGQGDIGDHFPPTDPQWKGAPSHLFVAHALRLVQDAGGRLINADLTLICERPRIKAHREAMRGRLAELLGLTFDRVSVKATTTEGMGFTGRGEGLAAQALVAVDMPG